MRGPDIHREVLDNLEDGVLVVGLGGRIETLNPAAERILGLEAGEADGRRFAELFILREGFDDFTQLVIDATTGDADAQRSAVGIRRGDEARTLSVATSYLRRAGPGGSSEAVAAIAVFSDITELHELRETELQLAREAEQQHRRLQDAYREIEDRNDALASALRKVRVVQGLGMVLALGLFVGAGLWTTRSLDLFEGGGAAAAAPVGGEGRMTVRPRRISDGITLRGKLAPWRVVAVQSAVASVVKEVHYRTGQQVTEGEPLVSLDLSRLRRDFAAAQRRHALTLEKLQELEDWENSREMVKARRTFTKANLDMDSRRTKINKSRFLFGEGLISASEHDDAERQFKGQELDFEAAKEEFAAVRALGGTDEIAAARLEVEAAEADMLERERQLRGGDVVRAPISGVVLAEAGSGRKLSAGGSVRAGQALLSIGDFSRMAASVKADETDVVLLRAGQDVTITGNAFAGLRLKGEVTHVSSQADPKARGVPKFDVRVTLDPVGPEEVSRLRAGMSARIRIVTYSNPKALLVPIGAVQSRGGVHRLRVVDPGTGEAGEREVEIGPTTRNSVEIRAGLEPGETILVPGG